MQESILVKYIGNDEKYWAKIKQYFNRDYKHLKLRFIEKNVGEYDRAKDLFISTYYEEPDIVYVDLSQNYDQMLSLLKLLCRNNVTRLKSTVALHELRLGRTSLMSATLAGVRINHYKSNEMSDVVYDPISLLDVNLAVNPQTVLGKELDNIQYRQILRLGYIDDDHFRVESNSPLVENEFVELDDHPLRGVMNSKRFLVESGESSDLYYNQRYSYKLKYTFIDTPLFRSTEESWKLFKKYKNNPLAYEEDTKKDYKQLVEDMNIRRQKFSEVKTKIKKWVEDSDVDVIPKRLKILVIDESLEMFKELDGTPESFPYSINFQTHLMKDYYQVKRSKPHLIIYHYEKEGNNESVLKGIVKTISAFSDYNPIILIFNYHDNSTLLKNLLDYKNILTYRNTIDLAIVKECAEKLDAKFKISNVRGKVFYKTNDPESVLTVSRKAKIVAITESVVYIQTKYNIPMWTPFIVDEPVQMLITIVPIKQDSPMFGKENVYCGIVHGVGEKEKSRLRVLVNKSLEDYEASK